MSDNRLEAACALAFHDSMREQGTDIREATASQYSIAFDAAAQAVARITDAERAVVEAAVAWKDEHRSPVLRDNEDALWAAVEALQKERE